MLLSITVNDVYKSYALSFQQRKPTLPYHGGVLTKQLTRTNQSVAEVEAISSIVDNDLCKTACRMDLQTHPLRARVPKRIINKFSYRGLDEQQLARGRLYVPPNALDDALDQHLWQMPCTIQMIWADA